MARLPPPRIGWPLLPTPDASGRLVWPTLEQSVEQSIRVLLQTRPGEQLMHPTFGGGLQRFVGEPSTVATKARIRDEITDVLQRYETRLLLDAVDLTDDPLDQSSLRVEIRYRLRRTGAPRSTSLTIALESA